MEVTNFNWFVFLDIVPRTLLSPTHFQLFSIVYHNELIAIRYATILPRDKTLRRYDWVQNITIYLIHFLTIDTAG